MVWNSDDVAQVYAGLMDPTGLAPKYMEMPAAHYAAHPYDVVLLDEVQVGVSITPACSSNERAWISLAIINEEQAKVGTELRVVWGEPHGGTAKPTVERHRQVEVKAEVHPWPIHESSRKDYRSQV